MCVHELSVTLLGVVATYERLRVPGTCCHHKQEQTVQPRQGLSCVGGVHASCLRDARGLASLLPSYQRGRIE
jgi:hypothetical protein